MINKNKVKRYCSNSLDLIENYSLAMNDYEETWDCHHRLEIVDGKVTTPKELIDRGLYYSRPAYELIFLRHGEHMTLHNKADCRANRWIEAMHSPESNAKRDKTLRENGLYKKWNEAGLKAAHSPEANAKRAKKQQKAVIQLTKECEFIKEYESVKHAEIETRICHISACARGERKSAGGFVWKYK